jgi:ABC-type glycerol-3-phosphate transport system substrate-binding protein
VGLVACSAPGSGSAAGLSALPGAVSTDTANLSGTLVLYDGAGLKPVDDALAAAFTKKYPKIKITGRYDPDDVQAQNAPRVLSSNTPPDIARIIALSDVVKNGQLTNLDPYATAYAWNELPAGQRAQFQVTRKGVRGSGSQYTVASGFTVTGLYYNKKLAQRIGMTTPPATVAELQASLGRAKSAGIVPMIVGNQTGQGVFPIQLMINNGLGATGVNDWVFHVPAARIDAPPAVAAVDTVSQWIKAGYFNADANGTDATGAAGRFGRGEGLFYPSGNWDAATVAKALGTDVGFVLPPAAEAGKPVAMSDPLSNFGIPAKSKNKDAAAAFLNFLLTDEARQIVADNGFAPSGSGAPPKTAAGVATEVQKAFADLVAANGQVQFVQNATSGISAVWNAQAQLLLAEKATPKEVLSKVQSQYTDELGS